MFGKEKSDEAAKKRQKINFWKKWRFVARRSMKSGEAADHWVKIMPNHRLCMTTVINQPTLTNRLQIFLLLFRVDMI
jgi:hypothetical protein